MAKILVADDNSNVQKTVTLALANLGIEVIAVNNGEAAVRKLPDVMPDLVLADIFMPVRNGYEVCEYIKKDKRFSHMPVVLLVGAFDPLDEREAQRVGADGILKKPFVPPDPLMMMVKTLLERTLGERLVAVEASKPAVSLKARRGAVAVADEHGPGASAEELPAEEFVAPVERVSFGEGERPIAFGQLLEAPPEASAAATEPQAIEPVDDEQILTSSRDASLGDPIFWKAEEPAPETDEQAPEAGAEVSADVPMRAWKLDETPLAPRAESDFLEPVEPFELVREDTDQQTEMASTLVESSDSIVKDAAEQAALTVEAAKPEELAANPLEWMASVPPPPEGTAETGVELSSAAVEPVESGANSLPAGDIPDHSKSPVELAATETTEIAGAAPPVSISAAAPSSSPSAMAPSEGSPLNTSSDVPDPLKTHPSLTPFAQSAEETARSIPKQEWADLAESLEARPVEPVAEKSEPAPASETTMAAVPAEHFQGALASETPSPASAINAAGSVAANAPSHSTAKQNWAKLSASFPANPFEPAEKSTLASHESETTADVASDHAPVTDASSAQVPSGIAAADQGTSSAFTPRSIPKQEWADLTASLQANPFESISKTSGASTGAPSESAQAATVIGPQTSASSVANGNSASPHSTVPLMPKQKWTDWVGDGQPKASEPALAAEPPTSSGSVESVQAEPVAAEGALPTDAAANGQSAPANSGERGAPDPALVEAVVQRVLEKMRPQVVDIITKEFLRPVVQALVSREIMKH